MSLKELFFSMLKVGCIGFGGGSALIPILHKVYVEEKEIISEADYEEDILIANITPGALTVKLAGEIGWRIAGWKGMLVAAFAIALPGVLLSCLILSFISSLNIIFIRQLEFLIIGIVAYIVCMLLDYVYKTMKITQQKNEGIKKIVITIFVFSLTCGKNLYRLLGITKNPFFSLDTLDIFIMTFFLLFFIGGQMTRIRIFVSVVLCVIYILCAGKNNFISDEWLLMAVKLLMLLLVIYRLRIGIKTILFNKLKWKKIGIKLGLLVVIITISLISLLFISKEIFVYIGSVILATMMSFGGGDICLTVADALFVETDIVTENIFYGTIIPITNILPGSILCKVVSGIGYVVGFSKINSILVGYIVGFGGLIYSIGTSCALALFIGYLYRQFREITIFQSVKQWIRAIISGLMLNVILSLIYQCFSIETIEDIGWNYVLVMFFILIINLWMLYRKKISSIFMVICSVITSFLFCNFFNRFII